MPEEAGGAETGIRGDYATPGVRLRHVLRGHGASIGRLAWSPDGSYLASASTDKTVRVWDVATGEVLHVFEGHTEWVCTVCFDPTGTRLVSGSYDRLCKVWDIGTGALLQTVGGHDDRIFSVAWSPSADVLATGSADNNIRLWDTRTWTLLAAHRGHYAGINDLGFSPDGDRLLTGSYDQWTRMWDVSERQLTWDSLLWQYRGHSLFVSAVAWSRDGQFIATGSDDNTVVIRSASGGRTKFTLEGHTDAVTAVAFSADGVILVSKSNDGTIRFWRNETGEELAVIPEAAAGNWFSGLAFDRDSPRLATLGERNTVIRIWDVDVDALRSGVTAPKAARYITAKLVLVGDTGVGKTGLGWRIAHGHFSEHASTHGQQFWSVSDFATQLADGTYCEAVLWDLAGQHSYRPVHALFLDNVDVAIIVFDPTNRTEPMKGVEFWLGQLRGGSQLPPTVLVGGREDVGASFLPLRELQQFCARESIVGGYAGTSARTGAGIGELVARIKSLIPWSQMSVTVTTATFKRIKEHVLRLKEDPELSGVLVSPPELRAQLQVTDPHWTFTDAEMMTAVRHLDKHGVLVLKTVSGTESILLKLDLLAKVASSLVLHAEKHERDLGTLDEDAVLSGRYVIGEVESLRSEEREALLTLAAQRLISRNVCFREHLGSSTLLIFPGLIKQKRPLIDPVETADDISYLVQGKVENVYAALVVLLGYTPRFTRVNQWQNQAQYELGSGQICGFRVLQEREGEIELVLYYSNTVPPQGRKLFQGLFETLLGDRDVQVEHFPLVVCPRGHPQDRTTVVKRMREGRTFVFCADDGERVELPNVRTPPPIGGRDSASIQQQRGLAQLRTSYETHLVVVRAHRRDRAAPRCWISHAPSDAVWVRQFAQDLRDAGIVVLERLEDLADDDSVIVVGTDVYRRAWDASGERTSLGETQIRERLRQDTPWPRVIPILVQGSSASAYPPEVSGRRVGDFRDSTRYSVNLFDVVLTLYAMRERDASVSHLRQALARQWKESFTRPTASGETVFLSYAWGGQSEEVANALESAFTTRGVEIVRDKRHLSIKSSIKEFMDRLGRGGGVVVIVSDKYLKSPNCMYELLRIAQHGEFYERVFPVVLEDARIFDAVERVQ